MLDDKSISKERKIQIKDCLEINHNFGKNYDFIANEKHERKQKADYPYLMPHEFLFLVANALDRHVILSGVKMQKICIDKVDIGSHEGIQNYEGQKLDKIYQYDLEARTVR